MTQHALSPEELAEQINQLNDRAKAIVFTAPKEAEQLAKQAYTLTQSVTLGGAPYQRGIAESYAVLCRCYIQYANFLQAIDYGKQVFVICEKNSLSYILAETCGNVGYAYARIGQYVDGLRYYLQQEQISIKHGYRKLEAAAYLGRGLIYSFTGDVQKAIRLGKTSLEIFREIGDRRGVLLACNNLSYSYIEAEQYQQALFYGFEVLEQHSERNIEDIEAVVYTNIGRAYTEMKAFTIGKYYLEKASALSKGLHHAFVDLLVYWELGYLVYMQGDHIGAIPYLQTTIQKAVVQEQKLYQYKAHHILAKIYEQLNEPAMALAHFQRFHAIRDELVNLQNQTRLEVLEVEYTVESTRREMERSQQAAQELEQQIQSRTADLQAAFLREKALSQKLESVLSRELELQQLKTNIIHTASHEFRTPLAIINLSAGILFKQYEQLAPAKRITYWNRVQEQILYLTDMLQDIFTVNSATAIVPHYTTHPFDNFCCRLQTALIDAVQQAHLLQFAFSESTQPVTTDFDLVERILFNLTVNAIKFSDATAPIAIRCTHTEQSLLIMVADQGIGIPPAEIGLIFDLFYRASNVDTRRGLGLGLSVVQKLVHVLQGTVHAESPGVDQGATIHVTLPLLPMPALVA